MRATRFPLLAGLLLAAGGPLPAASLNGTYDDKGTQVAMAVDGPSGAASLHALLGQQPDPVLASLDFDGTGSVRFAEANGVLDIEIFGEQGQRIWHDRWSAREGFSYEGNSAVIRMQLGASPDHRWVLVLNPDDAGRVLEVKAYRVLQSLLGPHGEPVGTYVFTRRDD